MGIKGIIFYSKLELSNLCVLNLLLTLWMFLLRERKDGYIDCFYTDDSWQLGPCCWCYMIYAVLSTCCWLLGQLLMSTGDWVYMNICYCFLFILLKWKMEKFKKLLLYPPVHYLLGTDKLCDRVCVLPFIKLSKFSGWLIYVAEFSESSSVIYGVSKEIE